MYAKPIYITRKVIDTLRLTDTVYMVREQKHYAETDVFDIWISGYKPTLDSVRVYPKTEYRTITETIVKEPTRNEWALFVGGGINAFSTSLMPHLDISLLTPKDTVISANLGYYKGVTYGFTIQTRIK